MNCIGPTARSYTGSRSSRPPSVSRISAVPTPFSTLPMIGGIERPSACRTAPAKRPWLDSTRPMAATRGQLMWHAAGLAWAARTYASSAAAGIPAAANAEAAPVALTY
jgi:hypothetical protein